MRDGLQFSYDNRESVICCYFFHLETHLEFLCYSKVSDLNAFYSPSSSFCPFRINTLNFFSLLLFIVFLLADPNGFLSLNLVGLNFDAFPQSLVFYTTRIYTSSEDEYEIFPWHHGWLSCSAFCIHATLKKDRVIRARQNPWITLLIFVLDLCCLLYCYSNSSFPKKYTEMNFARIRHVVEMRRATKVPPLLPPKRKRYLYLL